MRTLRGIALCVVLANLIGCVSSAERVDVPPTPINVQEMTYRDVLTRARLQATAATEAFYLDNWQSLQSTAGSLEETAKQIPQAQNVPADKKEQIDKDAARLASLARELGQAAQKQDIETSNDRLQQIGLLIRNFQVQY